MFLVTTEGPLLEELMRRLSECPAEFLAPPLSDAGGEVDVTAVIIDVLYDLGLDYTFGGLIPELRFAPLSSPQAEKNRLQIVLISCWLLHDQWFRKRNLFAQVIELFQSKLDAVSSVVSAPLFVHDRDRREELARLILSALKMRPLGETDAQARDRLLALDSVERQRVVQEARKAHERAAEVRRQMVARAAQEAAAKVTRE